MFAETFESLTVTSVYGPESEYWLARTTFGFQVPNSGLPNVVVEVSGGGGTILDYAGAVTKLK